MKDERETNTLTNTPGQVTIILALGFLTLIIYSTNFVSIIAVNTAVFTENFNFYSEMSKSYLGLKPSDTFTQLDTNENIFFALI